MFKYYNMNQLVLPLDLEIKLQENDIAFHIHHLVESIPDEAFQPFPAEFIERIPDPSGGSKVAVG